MRYEPIFRCLFSALYLIGAMALSMFSLVATVMVLAVHHHDPSKPLPSWLKSILRMHPNLTKVGVNEPQRKPVRESTMNLLQVTDLNMETITDKKLFSETEKIQTSLLYSILTELKKLNKSDEVEPNEWKTAAERLDNFFFYAFLTITALLNIILLILYVAKA